MTRKTEALTDTGAKYEKEAYLKQLEEENRRLKELVAELSLDNKILKDVVSKNL